MSNPRCLGAVFLLLLIGQPVFAADSTTTEPTLIPEGWRLLVRRVPLSMMLAPPETSDVLMPYSSTRPGARQLDVRANLRKNTGLRFSPGTYVSLDERGQCIVALAPKEEIEALESLLQASDLPVSPLVRVHATLVEVALANAESFKGAAADSLRKAAGTTWREIRHWSALCASGRRIVAESKSGDDSASEADSADSIGSLLEIEPMVGPHDEISLNVEWRWSSPAAKSENSRLKFSSSAELHRGSPLVVGIWPRGNVPSPADSPSKSEVYALILNGELVDRAGGSWGLSQGAILDRLRKPGAAVQSLKAADAKSEQAN